MKAFAYIFVLSLLFLGVNPVISHLQLSSEQTTACCDECCCDLPDDACSEEDQDEDSDRSCDSGCDCGCQFHLNAVQFHFSNMQLAEEQEYFYGEYHNAYYFEFFSPLIHPPRFA